MLLREMLIKYEIANDKSHADVADEVGVSLSTYYRWIKGESSRLKKGTIKKLTDVLGMDVQKILDEEECFKPLVGTAKAGYGLFADEDIEDYIELGKADAARGDYFLRVVGDSMEGLHIYDGDIVYVKKTDTLPSGKIAIVLVGDEVTIKKVIYKDSLMILEASNPKYESRYFLPSEVESLPVRILGQVLFVRTDFA